MMKEIPLVIIDTLILVFVSSAAFLSPMKIKHVIFMACISAWIYIISQEVIK